MEGLVTDQSFSKISELQTTVVVFFFTIQRFLISPDIFSNKNANLISRNFNVKLSHFDWPSLSIDFTPKILNRIVFWYNDDKRCVNSFAIAQRQNVLMKIKYKTENQSKAPYFTEH